MTSFAVCVARAARVPLNSPHLLATFYSAYSERPLLARIVAEETRAMPSKTKQIEERLAKVERELKELKAALKPEPQVPWWQQISGAFKDDPVFDEIVRLGAAIRKADRKRSR